MSKVWLNSARQVLVDESGRPYLCNECPCYGSEVIFTCSYTSSWKGFDNKNCSHFYLGFKFNAPLHYFHSYQITDSQGIIGMSDDGQYQRVLQLTGESGSVSVSVRFSGKLKSKEYSCEKVSEFGWRPRTYSNYQNQPPPDCFDNIVSTDVIIGSLQCDGVVIKTWGDTTTPNVDEELE